MKKQIYIVVLSLCMTTGIFSCTGNNANSKRDASNKDTLLDRGKPAGSGKMDTGKEKANMRKK